MKKTQMPLNDSPLSLPILSGLFQRSVVEWRDGEGKIRKKVEYNSTKIKDRNSPGFCNYTELHNYLLREARNGIDIGIDIDYFTFNPNINTNLTLELDYWSRITVNKDFSNGLECYPVTVINSIDDEVPVLDKYITTNIFSNELNKDVNNGLSFTCCNCEDDCRDKLKCPCFQLTLANYDSKKRKIIGDSKIGYEYRNLFTEKKTLSGIFECNKNCSCKQSCLNRVVQKGTKWRLQIFKMNEKGWGVRTLNDIPNGAFVATYTGMILEDSLDIDLARHPKRNDKWKYLMELNVSKNMPELQFPRRQNISMPDPDIKKICTFMNTKPKIYNKVYRFAHEANARRNRAKIMESPNATSRKYVLDGKLCGNLGRFFNHSCDPNMFAQCVFVDTHDLKFPWVSFFATKDIRAGDELTWCYNYELDDSMSTPTEPIKCLCGQDNCVRIFC